MEEETSNVHSQLNAGIKVEAELGEADCLVLGA